MYYEWLLFIYDDIICYMMLCQVIDMYVEMLILVNAIAMKYGCIEKHWYKCTVYVDVLKDSEYLNTVIYDTYGTRFKK